MNKQTTKKTETKQTKSVFLPFQPGQWCLELYPEGQKLSQGEQLWWPLKALDQPSKKFLWWTGWHKIPKVGGGEDGIFNTNLSIKKPFHTLFRRFSSKVERISDEALAHTMYKKMSKLQRAQLQRADCLEGGERGHGGEKQLFNDDFKCWIQKALPESSEQLSNPSILKLF